MTLQRLLHFAKGGYFPSLDIFQNNCLLLRRLGVFPLTAANINLTAVQAGLGTRCTDKLLFQSFQSFFCLDSCTVCQSCCSALFIRRIDLNIDDIDPSVVLVLDQCKWNCPHFINDQLHTGKQCSIHTLHYTLCPLPSLALTFCRIASIQVVCATVQGRWKKKKEKPNLKLVLKNNKILVLLDIKPLL